MSNPITARLSAMIIKCTRVKELSVVKKPWYAQAVTPTNPCGILIGRFMPPHTGHQYLVRFARAFTNTIVIFVCTLPKDPIPGDLRYSWMKQLFPFARIVHITEEIPQAARGEQNAHRIWAQAIRKYLTEDPGYVFASESYGADFAAAL
ncbi:MAG: hypothetical protein E4H09_00915, partial [Spirochaetales bacterium]